MRTCPDCYSIVDDNAVFCDNCGFKLPPVDFEIEPTIKAEIPPVSKPVTPEAKNVDQAGACSSCGYMNMPGEMFCQNCGVQLAPVPSTPPPPPTPVSSQIAGLGKPSESPVEKPAAEPVPKSPIAPELSSDKNQLEPGVCSNCGFRNAPDEKFCQNCGQFLQIQEEEKPVSIPDDRLGGEVEQEAISQPEPEILSEAIQPEPSSAEVEVELPVEADLNESEQAVEPIAAMPAEEIIELTKEKTEPENIQPESPGGVPEFLETPAMEEVPVDVSPLVPVPGIESVDQDQLKSMAGGIRGKFIIRTSGVEIPLPSGHEEITIGRVDLVRNIFPDIDLSGCGGESSGVSRLHAKLVLRGNQLFIEDLNSTNYTFVNRLRLQPGQPYMVNDGDEIRLGLLGMIFRSL